MRRPLAPVTATLAAAIPAAAPADARPGATRRGVASVYGPHEYGWRTASGERLSPRRMTAASRTLPLGTTAKVVNEKTGRAARVVVNDRGPYAEGRILDVTPKAAATLGIAEADGLAPVVVTAVSPPPPR